MACVPHNHVYNICKVIRGSHVLKWQLALLIFFSDNLTKRFLFGERGSDCKQQTNFAVIVFVLSFSLSTCHVFLLVVSEEKTQSFLTTNINFFSLSQNWPTADSNLRCAADGLRDVWRRFELVLGWPTCNVCHTQGQYCGLACPGRDLGVLSGIFSGFADCNYILFKPNSIKLTSGN